MPPPLQPDAAVWVDPTAGCCCCGCQDWWCCCCCCCCGVCCCCCCCCCCQPCWFQACGGCCCCCGCCCQLCCGHACGCGCCFCCCSARSFAAKAAAAAPSAAACASSEFGCCCARSLAAKAAAAAPSAAALASSEPGDAKPKPTAPDATGPGNAGMCPPGQPGGTPEALGTSACMAFSLVGGGAFPKADFTPGANKSESESESESSPAGFSGSWYGSSAVAWATKPAVPIPWTAAAKLARPAPTLAMVARLRAAKVSASLFNRCSNS
mmetsp:Transcript_35465/g.114786  ORF Transcript_35465/g.114786 Transcript_35465/m.114786 type:complete len:267 (+) Transcript_35465:697-1497(+)